MLFRTFRQAWISSGVRSEGRSGELIAPILQPAGSPARRRVRAPAAAVQPQGALLDRGAETPTAAAWTSATLSTDSRRAGQCSVAALTASGTRIRLAAERARSSSPGSG